MRLLYTDNSGTHNIEIKNPNSNPEILEKISYLKDKQLNATLNLQITEHTSRHELMNYIHVLIFVYNGKKKDIEDLLQQNNLQANNLIAFELLDRRKTVYKEMCEDDNIFKTFIDEYKGSNKDQMKRKSKELLVKFLTELRKDNEYWIKEKENIGEKIQEIREKRKNDTLNQTNQSSSNNPKSTVQVNYIEQRKQKAEELQKEISDKKQRIESLRVLSEQLDNGINDLEELYKSPSSTEEEKKRILAKIQEANNKKKEVNQIIQELKNEIACLKNNQQTRIQVNSIEQRKQRAEELKDIICNASKELQALIIHLNSMQNNSDIQNLIKQKEQGKLNKNSSEYKEICEIINLINDCKQNIEAIKLRISDVRNELHSIEPIKSF